jgi:hypothetical protein
MLLLENAISTVNSFADIRFQHDASFIEFKDWLALNFLEGRTLPKTSPKRTFLSLSHQQTSKVTQVKIHSMLTLQNHSSVPLLNLSIFSRQNDGRIFSVNKLPDMQTIQFKFIKPGSYNLSYCPTGTTKPVEQWIHVSAKHPSISTTPTSSALYKTKHSITSPDA